MQLYIFKNIFFILPKNVFALLIFFFLIFNLEVIQSVHKEKYNKHKGCL